MTQPDALTREPRTYEGAVEDIRRKERERIADLVGMWAEDTLSESAKHVGRVRTNLITTGVTARKLADMIRKNTL